MPREVEISLNEREFIQRGLRENLRLDGRAFDEFRDLDLSFGEDYGSVDVRLGKTWVAARISCEVVAPFPDRKFDGIFTICTEFSPMASPAFEVGRPTEGEIILSRVLEKAIRRSSALDTESLCILAGIRCFAVRADIHILQHDGGLIDASCIALVAALLHFRRPYVKVEGESITIYSPQEREPIPLSMLHQPFCVTFSFFDNAEIILVNANLAEEKVREGELIITMNKHGEICQIAKYGGLPVHGLTLLNCATITLSKVKDIEQYIHEKLEQNNRKNNAPGLIAELSAENAR